MKSSKSSKPAARATARPAAKSTGKAQAKKVVIKSAKIMPMSESPMSSYKEPNRISIEKANNGFIVTKGYGTTPHIAKDMKEVNSVASKLLK